MKGEFMRYKTLKLLGLALVLFVITSCSLTGSGSGDEPAPTDESTSSVGGSGSEEEPAPTEEATSGSEDESVITSEGMPVTGTGLCANAYYPVREGATWSYLGTSTAADDYAFTNTITSTRSDGFTVSVEFDNVTLSQEWACTPDGILALTGGGNAGTLTASNVNLVIDTQNASGITYPSEILPGSTWTHTLDYTGTMDLNGEPAEASGDTTYNYTAVEVESITVPAGTFDAMKVEVVTTINIKAVFQGVEVPLTVTSTATNWYAQGVGWIKTVSSVDMAGIASTDTVELQSYSIP